MSTGTLGTATMRLVPVTFSGTRSGTGPVTLGQQNVLRWAEDQTAFGAVQCQTLNVAPGRSLNDVTTAIGRLISRHESLRTLFAIGTSSEWAQQVTASGELLVEVHEAGGQLDATAAMVKQRLDVPFALDREWPIRAAIITSGGAPAKVLLVLTHVAADYASLGIIARDFRRLMSNDTSLAPEPPALHPLDQAKLEMSPVARSRAEAAVRYWETTLRGSPQCMLAVPGHRSVNDGSKMATLRSRAAALALATIADRTRTSQSVVILAAVATLLGLRTNNDRCQITALCANRFAPASRDYVGTIAQDALIVVDLTAETFDAIIQATSTAALTAYYYSQYDTESLWRMIDRVSEDRGTKFHRDCVLNDLNGALVTPLVTRREASHRGTGDAANAMRDTRLEWTDTAPRPLLFYFEVFALTRHEMSLSVWADQSRFPAVEVADFLFAVERLLVAAEKRNVPARDIGELVGISPVLRDASWRRIDSSWIEMPAVQQLLDDVAASMPGVDTAQVFCTRGQGQSNAESLVAYISASGSEITPQILHAQCLERLADRPAAMAPAWYVICDRTPDDPAGLELWRHLPVRVEGSGRA